MPMQREEAREHLQSFTPKERDAYKAIIARGASGPVAIRQVMALRGIDPYAPDTEDKRAAFLGGATEGMSQGLAPKAAGLMEVAGHVGRKYVDEPLSDALGLRLAPSSAKSAGASSIEEAYLAGHDNQLAEQEAARALAPRWNTAGQVSGAVAPMLVGGALVSAPAKAPGFLRLAATNAAQGAAEQAVAGGLRSEAGDMDGVFDDAAGAAAMGAIGGAAGTAIGKGVGAGYRAVKDPDALLAAINERAQGLVNLADAHPLMRAGGAIVTGGGSEVPLAAAKGAARLTDKAALRVAGRMSSSPSTSAAPAARDTSKTLRLGPDELPADAGMPTLRLSPSTGDAVPQITDPRAQGLSQEALDFLGGKNPAAAGALPQTRPSPPRPASANAGIEADVVQKAIAGADEEAAKALRLSSGTSSMRRPKIEAEPPVPSRERTSTNVAIMRQQALDELDGPSPAVRQQQKARRDRARPKKTKGQLVGKDDPPMGPGRKNDVLAAQAEDDPLAGLSIGKYTAPPPSAAAGAPAARARPGPSDDLVFMGQAFPPGTATASQFRAMAANAGYNAGDIEAAIGVLKNSGFLLQ